MRFERFRLRYDADSRLHLAVTHAVPVISPRAARAALRQDLSRDEAVANRSSGV